MSSTPTPLDDNQKNSNDERMYSAIDAVMKNTEQTYDDFVNSFSVLKKEDLAPKKPDSKQTPESSEKLHNKMIQLADSLKAPTEELKPNQKSHDQQSCDQKSHDDDKSPGQTKVSQENETDELHEEVLEEGVVCGWMSQAGNQRSSVQFDNFLDDAGDDISDDDTGAGYTASFAAGSLESSKKPPEAELQSTVCAHQSHENLEQTADSKTIGANTEQKSSSQESLKESQTVSEQGTTQKSNRKEKRRKKARSQTTEGTSADHDTNNTDDADQVEDNTPSAHESIETMKNILLETFLSDFCEEMGLGAMGNMDFGSLSGMGLDENDESPTDNNGSGDDINFDEDPLELLMNITDTGLSNTDAYVKESISKSNENNDSVSKSSKDDDVISKCIDSGNADDKSEPGQSKKKKSRSRRRKKNKKNSGNSETGVDNINEEQNVSEESRNNDEDKSKAESKQAPKSNGEDRNDKNKINETVVSPEDKQNVSDSDEVSRTEPKNTSDENDTTEQTEESFSGKLLFPGEVDDDDTTTSVTKETRLEFKATYSDPPGNDNASTTQDCSDEVEPFTLDQDFDYDNVVLTPKYSPEDMERLSQLMTGKIIL